MAQSAILVLLSAATLVLLSSAGAVHADDFTSRTGKQVLKYYVPGPSLILAGPGTHNNNMEEAGFGTFAVYDETLRAALDINSETAGNCRGFFLVNGKSGTNIMMLFTLDLTNRGSIVVTGTYDLLERPKSVVPIIGGSGEFDSVKGYVDLYPVLPDSSGSATETLEATFYIEVHYTLPDDLSRRPSCDM